MGPLLAGRWLTNEVDVSESELGELGAVGDPGEVVQLMLAVFWCRWCSAHCYLDVSVGRAIADFCSGHVHHYYFSFYYRFCQWLQQRAGACLSGRVGTSDHAWNAWDRYVERVLLTKESRKAQYQTYSSTRRASIFLFRQSHSLRW